MGQKNRKMQQHRKWDRNTERKWDRNKEGEIEREKERKKEERTIEIERELYTQRVKGVKFANVMLQKKGERKLTQEDIDINMFE